MLSARQPIEKQGKTDKKLDKMQSIMPKDSTRGRNVAYKQCSRNTRNDETWFLHTVPCRSDSLRSDSTVVLSLQLLSLGRHGGFLPCTAHYWSGTWSTLDVFIWELISLLLLEKMTNV